MDDYVVLAIEQHDVFVKWFCDDGFVRWFSEDDPGLCHITEWPVTFYGVGDKSSLTLSGILRFSVELDEWNAWLRDCCAAQQDYAADRE